MVKELELQQVRKKIGYKLILAGVDLRVSAGEMVVLTGPNGAGKTTLLRIIAGLTTKSSGVILWDGQPGRMEQKRVGYLGDRPMLYESLTLKENLRFFGRLYGLTDLGLVSELLKRVGLYHYRYELAGNLSRGMLQRLALARVLLHDPELLLYDEPFTSLDLEGQRLLQEILVEEQIKGKIQLLITHQRDLLPDIQLSLVRLLAGRVVG